MFLVAGATTPIGALVARALIARGRRIRAILDDPARAGDLFHPSIQLVKPGPEAFEGVEAAALVGTDPSWAKHARAAGVRHAVVLGLAGNGETAYEQDTRRCIAEVEVAIECVTIVRTMPTMDLLKRAASSVAQEHTVRFPLGEGGVALADPRDVADMICASLLGMGDPCGEYTVTGPENLRGPEIAATLGRLLETPLAYKDDGQSDQDAWVRALAAEPRGTTMDVEYVLGRPARNLQSYLAARLDAFKPHYASEPLPEARQAMQAEEPDWIQAER